MSTDTLQNPEREIIISIESFDDDKGYEGFYVYTNKQKIEILIDNTQDCCEIFGHISSDEDFEHFKGAELLDICIVNDRLESTDLKGRSLDDYVWDSEECRVLFVNLITGLGILQFTLYNIHNGFYGHTVKVISDKLNKDGVL